MVRTSRLCMVRTLGICSYAAHHPGIVIAADRCREQMKLPVDQIDSCGHLRVHEKSAMTKCGVCSIAIDRGSKTHQKSAKNHCGSTNLLIFSIDYTMKPPFSGEINHSKHAFIQDILKKNQLLAVSCRRGFSVVSVVFLLIW